MRRRQRTFEKAVELFERGLEIGLYRFVMEGLQSLRRIGQAARRLADAEIDAAGREVLQHAEGFRNLERAVVLQHHAAGSDPDAPGDGEQISAHDLRRGAGEKRRGVMLGDPEAFVAEIVGAPGELDRMCERLRRRRAGWDRALVEDGKRVGHRRVP